MLFLEDLFRETMKCGTWKEGDPKEMAVEFYAPFYLLLSISDGAADKIEKENAARLLRNIWKILWSGTERIWDERTH